MRTVNLYSAGATLEHSFNVHSLGSRSLATSDGGPCALDGLEANPADPGRRRAVGWCSEPCWLVQRACGAASAARLDQELLGSQCLVDSPARSQLGPRA